MRKYKICMVVPSRTVMGGIAAVVKEYESGFKDSDFEINFVETYCDGNKIRKLFAAIKGYINFIKCLLFFHPNIIHIHVSFGPSFYRKLLMFKFGFLLKIPVIAHIHGSYINEFYINASKSKQKLVRSTFSKTAYCIVLSDYWKKEFSIMIPDEKMIVVENFSLIPPERSNLDKNNVLFLGFVTKLKGCYDIPKIAEKVVKQVPDAKFYIGGIGDQLQIEKSISESIKENIVFLGWVEKEQKDQLLRESSCFLLPSYSEGMPMSILEAMSYGLPIVSTDVGAIPEVVENGNSGYLSNPGDIDDISKNICNILLDNDLKKSMSNYNFNMIKSKYSLDRHITSLKKIYMKVIGDSDEK